jgi:hypothetical protein
MGPGTCLQHPRRGEQKTFLGSGLGGGYDAASKASRVLAAHSEAASVANMFRRVHELSVVKFTSCAKSSADGEQAELGVRLDLKVEGTGGEHLHGVGAPARPCFPAAARASESTMAPQPRSEYFDAMPPARILCRRSPATTSVVLPLAFSADTPSPPLLQGHILRL